jgi:ATP-dependent Zn protease
MTTQSLPKRDHKTRTLRRTATHEAGHATASFALRRAVKEVSIIPDEQAETLGYVVNHRMGQTIRPDVCQDHRHRAWVEREIILLLAGGAAENA